MPTSALLSLTRQINISKQDYSYYAVEVQLAPVQAQHPCHKMSRRSTISQLLPMVHLNNNLGVLQRLPRHHIRKGHRHHLSTHLATGALDHADLISTAHRPSLLHPLLLTLTIREIMAAITWLHASHLRHKIACVRLRSLREQRQCQDRCRPHREFAMLCQTNTNARRRCRLKVPRL